MKTSLEIVKSSYLNYSDEWARNRFKILKYYKRKITPSSMESNYNVFTKNPKSQ